MFKNSLQLWKKTKKNPLLYPVNHLSKKSALASFFLFVPRHVLGGVGYTAPSDQLNIAAIGSGGKGFSDFREMLDAEPNIDAVTISTPDHTHAPAAKCVMDRGVHVYVQNQ